MATFLYKTKKTKRTGYEKVAVFTVTANGKTNTCNNVPDLESNLHLKADTNGYGSLSNGNIIKKMEC